MLTVAVFTAVLVQVQCRPGAVGHGGQDRCGQLAVV